MAKITAGMFRAGLFWFLWQASTGLVFEDNKVYTYSYEVQMETGMADSKISQFAVRNFNATLVIKMINNKALFQISDLKADAYNLRNQKLRFQESFARLHYSSNFGSWNSFLQQPFSVEFDNGMIVAIEVPDDAFVDEPNIHRAIASLFQMNLRPFSEENKMAYSETEDGIGGDCSTTYQVNPHSYEEGRIPTDNLKVTKIRLYDECTQRPSLFYTSLKGYPCPSCRQSNKPLTRLSRTEYKIKSVNGHFKIERINSEGTITFAPFGIHGQTVSSIVRQTLTLLNVEDKPSSMPRVSKWKRYSSLSFVFLKSNLENQRSDMSRSTFSNWIHKSPSSRNILQKAKDYLAKSTVESVEGLKQAMRLKDTFQSFTYADFVHFFGDLTNFNIPITEVAKLRRNVLINVLPMVGTYPAVNFMLNLIHLRTVNSNEGDKMLSSLPLYLKESSLQLLETFWQFLQENKDESVFNSGWLSFGSVVYKSCVANEFNPRKMSGAVHIEEPTCNRVLEKMILEFRNAKIESKRMTLLRAIKNTRYPSSLKFFFVILRGKYSIYLRHTALCGISLQIDMHKREEISSMVTPVYLNYNEDDILRIYAFELLLYLSPPSEFFSGLVANLAQEPSQQVASHIYSTLTSFANSTDPCHEKFADHAKLALRKIPEPNYDILTHSFNRHFTYHNDKYLFGRSGQISLLGSNSTVFPREIYFRQGFNLLGYNFDIVEYGLTNSNPFYLDLLILTLRQSLGLMPGPSHHPKVLKSLKYKEVKPPENYEFELYAKIFNQDVFLANTLDGLQSKFVSDSSNPSKEIHKEITTYEVRSYDATYVIPNEFGVPTILSLEIPVQLGFNGSVTLNPYKSSISTDGQVSLTFVSYAKMSMALTSFAEDGFLLKSSGNLVLPMTGSASYKPDDHKHKIQLKYIPSKSSSHHLLHYDSEPSTFLASIGSGTSIEGRDSQIEKKYTVGHDYFGLGLQINLRHEKNWNAEMLKSFFHKTDRKSDFFYLSEKIFAGINGLADYAILNPAAKYMQLDVFLQQSQSAPTTELSAALQTSFKSVGVERNKRGLDITEVAAKIVAKGPQKREWLTGYHIDYYWPVKDERTFKFYFKRSPIPQYDKDEFEVCIMSNMSISNYTEVFTDFLAPEPIPVKLYYDARLFFGKSCGSTSQQLKIKVIGEKSEHLLALDKSSLPFLEQCRENIAAGFAFSFPCWLAKKHAGRLDKFTVDLQDNNFSANLKDTIFRTYSWIRHIFYENLRDLKEQTGLKNENHVQAVANFSFNEPFVDVIVTRPDQQATYKDIYIPAIVPQYQPFTIAENVVERFSRNAFNFKPPFCILSGDNVRTFDGVVYQYSVNECGHVVFSECTKGEIAVLYRRIQGNSLYTKAVKVLIHDSHIIEMVPEGNDSIAVTVDKLRLFTDGSRIHSVHNKDGTLLMHVFHDVDGYVVEVNEYDFEFFFNGNDLELFVSAFYKGKHCGLCGNYDGKKIGEFVGPDGKQHQTVESFARSYALKGRENYCN